ncbi:DUF4013 domain-containing protein [Haloarcula litorea]|uniref:DUF4013 domain-containing protein n=1 Tax=Haloarcula litorea TaxID=3032579 RepID=UPI0023E7B64B|nr:DUF4013 domain-containing protein [Halomicroarcula sp. GDY20]
MALEDSLTYPTDDDDWITTVLVGGVLTLLGVLIVPTILVSGYLVRVIRSRADGEAGLPAFEDWTDLLVDGLKATVISVVYMLVPLVVAGVAVGGALVSFATGSDLGAGVGLFGLLAGLLVSGLLTLVFGYLAVAGLVNFACEREFGAAFDVDTVRTLALSREYAVPWLVSVAVFLGASVVVGVLNGVPLLGTVVGAFVFFYAYLVAADLWATGYNAALDDRPERQPASSAAV